MIDAITIILVGLLVASTYAAIKYYREYKKYKPYKKQYYDTINPPIIKPHTSERTVKARMNLQDWLELRSRILLRDLFRCRECNYFKHLEVHHIIPKSKGGTDDPDNLITLCGRCHAKKHGFAWRENKRNRHTRRNRQKKFNRYLRNRKEFMTDITITPASIEDMYPQESNLARRQALLEKWKRNELNQPN